MNKFQQELNTLSTLTDKVEYLLIPMLAEYKDHPRVPPFPILGMKVEIGSGTYTVSVQESVHHDCVELVFTDATTTYDEKKIDIPMEYAGGYISYLKQTAELNEKTNTTFSKNHWWVPEVFNQVKGIQFNHAIHSYINNLLSKRHFHAILQHSNNSFYQFITKLVYSEHGVIVKFADKHHVRVDWHEGIRVFSSKALDSDDYHYNRYAEMIGGLNNGLFNEENAYAIAVKLYQALIVVDQGTFKPNDIIYHREFGLRPLREKAATLRRQEIFYRGLEDYLYTSDKKTRELFEYHAFDLTPTETVDGLLYNYLNSDEDIKHMDLTAFLSDKIENNEWLTFLEKFITYRPSEAVHHTLEYTGTLPMMVKVTRLPTLKDGEVLKVSMIVDKQSMNINLNEIDSPRYRQAFAKLFSEEELVQQGIMEVLLKYSNCSPNLHRAGSPKGAIRLAPELAVLWEVYCHQVMKD